MISKLSAVVVSTLLLASLPAAAQELSARELKKAQRQADKAFAADQVETATGLYQQILASTQPGDKLRGNALYAVALAGVASDPASRDAAATRAYLDELAADFPRFDRRLEVATLRRLLDEVDAGRAEIERHDAELAEKAVALDDQQQEDRQEAAAGDAEVKKLETRLRRALDDLAKTRAELAKKEEALEKLKDALVGGGR